MHGRGERDEKQSCGDGDGLEERGWWGTVHGRRMSKLVDAGGNKHPTHSTPPPPPPSQTQCTPSTHLTPSGSVSTLSAPAQPHISKKGARACQHCVRRPASQPATPLSLPTHSHTSDKWHEDGGDIQRNEHGHCCAYLLLLQYGQTFALQRKRQKNTGR